MNIRFLLLLSLLISSFPTLAQHLLLKGRVTDASGKGLESIQVRIPGLKVQTQTDASGDYELKQLKTGTWQVFFSHTGFQQEERTIHLTDSLPSTLSIRLEPHSSSLKELVVTGTMKTVSKLDSPVPVEVYSARYFRANPTPSLFDALQHINGVRPQLNCNICNTGDIHINGLEGPYTMILLDGMPIVSGLSTVYGLSGIPSSLIDRVEIVKGPASTLYGSEAVGGLINVITKSPEQSDLLSADLFSTSWQEHTLDIAGKWKIGQKIQSLTGINYFHYQQPMDHNHDHFTDVTLQQRFSLFNKWTISRPEGRVFRLAGRYIYEDRWGGEMNWDKHSHRGGDNVYGESIYTKRWEALGTYQLPSTELLMLQFSANGHQQNSAYGEMLYLADQYVAFTQLTWNKALGKHDLLSGLSYRYTYYDDNTPATFLADEQRNNASRTHLPGFFLQDEIRFNDQHSLLAGLRYDYNSIHGSIVSPRLNYKHTSIDQNEIIRISIGNGYRVAHVFTEDHAALTGARKVVFLNDLRPETSWNANVNYVRNFYLPGSRFIGIDAAVFYTHFTNKIVADYEQDPNLIIYDNLGGYAISRGLSLNLDMRLLSPLQIRLGATFMDVHQKEGGEKTRQLFTERFTGTWNINYRFPTGNWSMDYTGNVYSPMRLPLLSELDPRSAYSPWWSIQNIQVTKTFKGHLSVYGGVKNLLNWRPGKKDPFLIARSHDPFDRQVVFDAQGQAVPTAENPYGLTFDPSYVYGPNQGIRAFIGIRYRIPTSH